LVNQAALAFELWTGQPLSTAQCVSVYEALLVERVQGQTQ
jgi:shikimate 5-dehydrogenase